MANRNVKRGQLPEPILVIDENFNWKMLDLLLYLSRIVANNYDGFTNLRSFQCPDDSFNKGLPVDGEQRFGTPHAARLTGGENNSNDHGLIRWRFAPPKTPPNPPLSRHPGRAFFKEGKR